MGYRLAADAVVVVHAAYASFVVVGILLTWLGVLLRWGWVRNFWFRMAHLLAILIVVAESALNIECPLTTFERFLRNQAGQSAYQGDFIANWVHELLFFENVPAWVFTLIYTLFGVAILATFILVPPRWPKQKSPEV